MTISEQFKQQLQAGNIGKALEIALSQALEFEVITWIEHSVQQQQSEHNEDHSPQPGGQIRTRLSLLDGRVENAVGSLFLAHGNYTHLQEFHLKQVREGQILIQNQLKGLQMLLESWQAVQQGITGTTRAREDRSLPIDRLDGLSLASQIDRSVRNDELSELGVKTKINFSAVAEPLSPPSAHSSKAAVSTESTDSTSELFTDTTAIIDFNHSEPQVILQPTSAKAVVAEDHERHEPDPASPQPDPDTVNPATELPEVESLSLETILAAATSTAEPSPKPDQLHSLAADLKAFWQSGLIAESTEIAAVEDPWQDADPTPENPNSSVADILSNLFSSLPKATTSQPTAVDLSYGGEDYVDEDNLGLPDLVESEDTFALEPPASLLTEPPAIDSNLGIDELLADLFYNEEASTSAL